MFLFPDSVYSPVLGNFLAFELVLETNKPIREVRSDSLAACVFFARQVFFFLPASNSYSPRTGNSSGEYLGLYWRFRVYVYLTFPCVCERALGQNSAHSNMRSFGEYGVPNPVFVDLMGSSSTPNLRFAAPPLLLTGFLEQHTGQHTGRFATGFHRRLPITPLDHTSKYDLLYGLVVLCVVTLRFYLHMLWLLVYVSLVCCYPCIPEQCSASVHNYAMISYVFLKNTSGPAYDGTILK